MRGHLSAREYYHEASASTATPAYIRLATAIAHHQPDLIHVVIEMFECTLRALGSQRVEFSRLVLDATITVMRDCHAVDQCMAMVNNSGVRRGRDGHRGSRNGALLQNYANAWASMPEYNQLNPKEIAFLQEVAK
eukprot:gene8673-34120_t